MVGYFIGFGLNKVDSTQYNGWNGELKSAEKDIQDLSLLAEKASFVRWGRLLGEKATSSNVIDSLMKLSVTAQKGDIVWIAYSGHGAQSQNGVKKVESYCLYDGLFPEIELRNLISALPSGVRVVVTLDCCHSGGFEKAIFISKETKYNNEADLSSFRVKVMPFDISMLVKALPMSKKTAKLPMNGGQHIKWLMACQKTEYALDGAQNGVFTAALLAAYRDSNEASYGNMYRTMYKLCEAVQHPQFKNTSHFFADTERFLKI